jgi:hypothetical protein
VRRGRGPVRRHGVRGHRALNTQVGDDTRGHPTTALTAAPAEQRSILAILRRPQTEADRSPEVRDALTYIGEHETQGVRLADVRLLSTHQDGVMVLVPVERAGTHDPGAASSIERDALLVLYSGRPSADAGAVGSGLVPSPPAGRLRVVQTRGTLASLKSQAITAIAPTDDGYHLFGLAPDRAVKAEVTLRGGAVVRSDIVNNSFDLPIGAQPGDTHLRLFDPEGRVVVDEGA